MSTRPLAGSGFGGSEPLVLRRCNWLAIDHHAGCGSESRPLSQAFLYIGGTGQIVQIRQSDPGIAAAGAMTIPVIACLAGHLSAIHALTAAPLCRRLYQEKHHALVVFYKPDMPAATHAGAIFRLLFFKTVRLHGSSPRWLRWCKVVLGWVCLNVPFERDAEGVTEVFSI